MSRFAAVDPDFIKELSNASTPANTTKSTKQWVNTFNKWAVENGIVRNFLSIFSLYLSLFLPPNNFGQ